MACTLAPEDSFAALWLEMQADAEELVDLTTSRLDLDTGERHEERAESMLIDPAVGAAIYLQPGAAVKALPRSRLELVARARGPRGERVLGRYVLNHTPWHELRHDR